MRFRHAPFEKQFEPLSTCNAPGVPQFEVATLKTGFFHEFSGEPRFRGFAALEEAPG